MSRHVSEKSNMVWGIRGVPLEVWELILGFLCAYQEVWYTDVFGNVVEYRGDKSQTVYLQRGDIHYCSGMNLIDAIPSLAGSLKTLWRMRLPEYPLLEGTLFRLTDAHDVVQRFIKAGHTSDLRMYAQKYGVSPVFDVLQSTYKSIAVLTRNLAFRDKASRNVFLEAVVFLATSQLMEPDMCPSTGRNPTPAVSNSGMFYKGLCDRYEHIASSIIADTKTRLRILLQLMALATNEKDIIVLWHHLTQGASRACAFLLFVLVCASGVIHPGCAMTVKAWTIIAVPRGAWLTRIYNGVSKCLAFATLQLESSKSALVYAIARTVFSPQGDVRIPEQVQQVIPWSINCRDYIPSSRTLKPLGACTSFNPIASVVLTSCCNGNPLLRDFDGIASAMEQLLSQTGEQHPKMSIQAIWSRLNLFFWVKEYVGFTRFRQATPTAQEIAHKLVCVFLKCMFRDTIVLLCGKPGYEGDSTLNDAVSMNDWNQTVDHEGLFKFSRRYNKMQERIRACNVFVRNEYLVRVASRVLENAVSTPPIPRKRKRTAEPILARDKTHPFAILKRRLSRFAHQDCDGEERWVGTPIRILLDAVEAWQEKCGKQDVLYICAVGTSSECFEFVHANCWRTYVPTDESLDAIECNALCR